MSPCTRILGLAFALLFVAACGGGGDSPAPAPPPVSTPPDPSPTTAITGVVTNGPIAGARVEIWNSDRTTLRATTTTDPQGNYAVQVLSGQGTVMIVATGGTMAGRPYDGELVAACSGQSSCQVTPISTLVVRMMDRYGFNPSDAQAHLANLLGFEGDPFLDAAVGSDRFNIDGLREALDGGRGLEAWLQAFTDWVDNPDGVSEPPGVDVTPPAAAKVQTVLTMM